MKSFNKDNFLFHHMKDNTTVNQVETKIIAVLKPAFINCKMTII